MIVLDGSVGVELARGTRAGLGILRRLRREPRPYHVPHLSDLEVVQVLRRDVPRQLLPASAGGAAIRAPDPHPASSSVAAATTTAATSAKSPARGPAARSPASGGTRKIGVGGVGTPAAYRPPALSRC